MTGSPENDLFNPLLSGSLSMLPVISHAAIIADFRA
jgi:hypothetical protein